MSGRAVLRRLLPVLVIGALIGLWQIAASTGWIAEALNLEPFLVPSPAEVGDALWSSRAVLWENTWVTLREILIGLVTGVLAGIALAVAMRFSRLLRDAVFPLSVAVQAVPVVVIAPILVVWFGYGIWPKVTIVALACFFPILVNTLDGLRSVEPRGGEDDAHAGRLTLGDLPPGRSADRPARLLQRRQDRRRRRPDRRPLLRAGGRQLGTNAIDRPGRTTTSTRRGSLPRRRSWP